MDLLFIHQRPEDACTQTRASPFLPPYVYDSPIILMGFNGLLVSEIFYSLQGESSLSGLPFVFIRLSGCNLRCTYCDTSYSFKGGNTYSIKEVLEKIHHYPTPHVLITGGEPLLQRQTPALIEALIQSNRRVSIETHGEVSLGKIPASLRSTTRIIMDIKTPASGMSRGGFIQNFKFLKSTDEIKLVIASKEDYLWAKNLVLTQSLPTQEILFSAAMQNTQQPGKFPGIEPAWLAEKILEDRLPVRLQLQLHKILWGEAKRGV